MKNQSLKRKWVPKFLPKDWREKSCRSCWAFSATGAIESALAIKTGRLVLLSEQQLVDCTPYTKGCNGGANFRALQYVKNKPTSTGGIQTARSYPYKYEQGPRCKFNPTKVGAYMADFKRVTPTEDELKAAVYHHGPVSVAVHITDSFKEYTKGVFIDNGCGNGQMKYNHAMLVVGYGTEEGQDYWLVKNSWGTKWGEKGYIKMARNRNNMCGIAFVAFIPIGVSPTPVRQNPLNPVVGNQLGNRSPAGVSPCSSSAMVAINTSLLMLLFAAILSV